MRKLKSSEFRRKCMRIISCVVFLCIALTVFIKITYLYRDANSSRETITEIAAEEDDIDVLFIGSSCLYMFWQPLTAWNDCGFTSYNYQTWLPEAVQYIIKDFLETQDPVLIVIDYKLFTSWSDEVNSETRRYTDSLDLFSITRWKFLTDYLNSHTAAEDTDITSYYFDIIKYHTSTTALSSEDNWGLINNSGESAYRGYEVFEDERYAYLDEPEWNWDVETELTDGCKEVLEELIIYCQEKNVEILFVASPSFVLGENAGLINAINTVLDEYNGNHINMWEYLDEIGLDFNTDYADANHTNYYGALKYTAYMEEYLIENYDLPDHREDDEYDDWTESYEIFLEDMADVEASLDENISNREEAFKIEAKIAEIDDVLEWLEYAQNEYMVKLVAWQGDNVELSDDQIILLESLGVTILAGEVQLIEGRYTITSEEFVSVSEYNAVLRDGGYHGETEIDISVTSDNSSIVVNGSEFSLGNDGLNIVLYDNNLGTVIDSVTIMISEEGEFYLTR